VAAPRSNRKNSIPKTSANGLFSDEEPDIEQEVKNLIADPGQWLDTPNTQLGGTRPKDLIGTDREQFLRDLLRSIKYGMPT
jgi:hypothetical protein